MHWVSSCDCDLLFCIGFFVWVYLVSIKIAWMLLSISLTFLVRDLLFFVVFKIRVILFIWFAYVNVIHFYLVVVGRWWIIFLGLPLAAHIEIYIWVVIIRMYYEDMYEIWERKKKIQDYFLYHSFWARACSLSFLTVISSLVIGLYKCIIML